MPAVEDNSALILLSGASGFIAAHIGQQLLERGFSVRGSVRTEKKGEYLKRLYERQGLTKFEWVVVEDICTPGAFDEAVKGVSGVVHTASPFHYNTSDPVKDLIEPALNGTRGILQSALLEPKVQRVVITSSAAATMLFKSTEPPYTYTEADWNTVSTAVLEEKGADIDALHAYCASKTLAERAGWDFVQAHTVDGVAPFDLSTILPPFVLGPILHEVPSAKALNTSVGLFYPYLKGESASDPTASVGCFIDVRDVAKLHVDALVTPAAGGERFCTNNGPFAWQMLLDVLHAPENKAVASLFPKAVVGVPGGSRPPGYLMDSSKAKRVLSWTPLPMEKTTLDMASSLAEREKEW